MIDPYCHFEVPKKGEAKKPINFHALRDMDRRGKWGDEDDPSTSGGIPKDRYSPKVKKCARERSETFAG